MSVSPLFYIYHLDESMSITGGFSACLHPKVSQELLDLTKQDEDIMSKMTAYDEEQKQKLENLNQVIKEKQKQDL